MSSRNALFWLAVLAVFALAGGLAGVGGPGGGSGSGSGALGAGEVSTTRTSAGARPADDGRTGEIKATAGATVAAQVTRVVDGDTARVQDAAGAADTVRYIGVDTPESVKPNTPVQCYAKEASHRNDELVSGQAVRLVIGTEPRDRYGRLLAYVYRVRDGAFVNATLLSEGLARTLTIKPNDRYADRFATLADAARSAQKGLWGSC